MADNRDDIWNDDDGEEPPKRGGFKRFLVFLLTLLVVLGVVAVAAWRDGTGIDVVRRWLHYGSSAGETGTYAYDADRSNRFAPLGSGLVVASSTGISLLDGSGKALWSENLQMEAPAISVGGGRAAVVDCGGAALKVLDEKGLVYQLEAERTEPFVTATLNENGYLAVTTEKKGTKGAVSVYDPSGNQLYGIDYSARFVTDACVSPDNKCLAIVTLGQENGVFVSNIVLYPLNSETPSANYTITDGLVLSIGNFGDTLVTVSDTGLAFADTAGQIAASYGYSGYLQEFDLGGDDFVTLLVNRYKAGSTGRLVTVDAAGQELGSLAINEQVLNLSASSRYLAVLYADSLAIYTPDLIEYARLRDTGAIRDICMRPDGSVLLLGAEKGTLYLP